MTATNETPACPDCDAERRVTPCTIAGRPSAIVETIHASTCPLLRGVTR